MNPPGRVLIEEIESRALAGNRMGDPHLRRIPVYLPPGYEGGPPGVPGDLLAARILGHRAWGEDFVVEEIVAHIDRRYRTLASPAHRGINGKSSGGYGALVLAMRHPDVFGGVASHSGDMFFEACYKPDFWKFCNTVARHGGVEAFLHAFLAMPKKTDTAMTAVNVAAMAMAYSPNIDRPPFYFDLPFDPRTGELDDAVWRRWLAWDPVLMVERYADNLKRLRLIYFECGWRDQFFLHLGARQLHDRLGRLGIAHEYQEFDDNHTAVNYRYVESLRRLCEALAGPHGG